jgi:hypothetical protein
MKTIEQILDEIDAEYEDIDFDIDLEADEPTDEELDRIERSRELREYTNEFNKRWE